MVAIEFSDSKISHRVNDLRACSELDSGLHQNWCLCAQILVPTLQVSLRSIHSLLAIFLELLKVSFVIFKRSI